MPFRRIVVGVDFSAPSLAALRWVARTVAPRAHIHIVHVVPDPRTSALLRPYVPAVTDDRRSVSDAYQALRGLADATGAKRVDLDILKGAPADALALAAEEAGADLICVGRSLKRRGSGRFGGTTPHRLLARTHAAVLSVPERASTVPGAILAAVSDGTEAPRVLDSAARLANEWSAHLDALHALEPEVQELEAAALRLGCDARLSIIAQNWLVGELARRPGRRPSTTTVVPFGDAGEEIVAHATRGDVGLIVAGRRRENQEQPAGPELGSSARLMLWAAPCPVLVLETTRVAPLTPGACRGVGHAAPALTVASGGDAA